MINIAVLLSVHHNVDNVIDIEFGYVGLFNLSDLVGWEFSLLSIIVCHTNFRCCNSLDSLAQLPVLRSLSPEVFGKLHGASDVEDFCS